MVLLTQQFQTVGHKSFMGTTNRLYSISNIFLFLVKSLTINAKDLLFFLDAETHTLFQRAQAFNTWS